ncbi:MAG: hypothetical protein ACTTKL_07915 [Treponema sp.]
MKQPNEQRILKSAAPSPIDIRRELQKVSRIANRFKTTDYFKVKEGGVQSSFFDPYRAADNVYGNLRTADRRLNREIDCQTLRRVSKKAWIINLCITNVQKKIRPFLKPSTNRNLRGFVIHKKGEDVVKAGGQQRMASEQYSIVAALPRFCLTAKLAANSVCGRLKYLPDFLLYLF